MHVFYLNTVGVKVWSFLIAFSRDSHFENHIAEHGNINQLAEESNRWLVQSESDKERYYVVTLDNELDVMWHKAS